jgi:hypothetical protein
MDTIRNKKLLAAANGQRCVNCGVKDDTVVAAHYQGIRAHLLGKGKGTKPHDLCVADLCTVCHRKFDNYEISSMGTKYLRQIDQSEQFLYCVMQTLIRRYEQDILNVK